MKEPHSEREFPTVSGPESEQSRDFRDRAPEVEGYRVVGELGRGGMATVWRAVQLSTQREVALKIMGSSALGSKRVQARFEREVELSAKLNHPSIARVYESGMRQGLYYYAMELVEGANLDKYVKRNKLSQRQILELLLLVCRGVQHAHESGVIHRDLKPSNIMVSEDGQPHILDFGLAKTYLDKKDYELTISLEGEMIGTLPYMSPEQAAGKRENLDTRTDVYSLGLILYRLLTGITAHDLSGTQYAVMRRIAEEEVKRPREITKKIDRELEALLLKALAREPSNRYGSAGELAQDIENYMNNEPLTARVPTTGYFLAKKINKHRKKIIFCVAALTIIIVGIALELDRDVRVQLAEDIALAQRYIDESRYDLALGLAMATQRRFPGNKQVEQIVRLAEGTTTLGVSFELGTLTKASLRTLTDDQGQSATDVDVRQLASPEGIDIEPGWYWLDLNYTAGSQGDASGEQTLRHLLFVSRSTPYRLQIRQVIIGNVPGAEFATLHEAISNCTAGNILSIAPGEYELGAELYAPNVTIESLDSANPAVIRLTGFGIWHTYDISIRNITFEGIGAIKHWPGIIQCVQCVYVRILDCVFDKALIDGIKCDSVQVSSNHFRNYMHHRGYYVDCQRVVVNNNTVDSTAEHGVRAIDFVRCRGVLAFGNTIGKSASSAIRVRVCADTHLAGNTITGGVAGSLYVEHSHGLTVCFNELHSSDDYNVRLFDSHAGILCHNQITGSDKSLRMIIVNETLLQRNLIADSNNAFSFSSGQGNVMRENIFSGQKRFVAETATFDSDFAIESNLINGGSMLDGLPPNSPDIRSSNTVRDFGASETGSEASRSAFGPDMSLRSTAEKVFAVLAEGMLNFRPAKNVRELCEDRLDDYLSAAILRASDSLNTIPMPQRDSKQFGRYFAYVEAMRQLAEDPNNISDSTTSFEGHHYMLYASPVSWEEAKVFCESVGGHLATINSGVEQNWVWQTFGESFDLWLGGTDAGEEGIWRWITGEKWRYANWGTGEPNNLDGNENRLLLQRSGAWRDNHGGRLFCFLIEWDY